MGFRVTPLRLAAALAAATVAGTSVAYAASLSLTSEHLGAGSQTLVKGSCDQSSGGASTAWVDQANPARSNPGSIVVQSQNKADRHGFVRWSLSGCGLPTTGGADTAVLSLRVASSSKRGHTITVYPVYSSWSASSLTWSSAGSLSLGPAVGSFKTSTGTKTVTVTGDLDRAIKVGTFWGYELVDTAGGGKNTTTIDSPSLALDDER